MNTKVLKPSADVINSACELIALGEVVAIPTETVYGLFADATSTKACEGIFKAKDRPQDNPLIVHVSDYDMLNTVAKDLNEDVIKLAEAFWPGPLTMVVKKQSIIPDSTSAGLDTVGVRMPSNTIALEIIKKTNLPLAGPSANRSGRPSPTNAQYVYRDLDGRLPLIIDGGACDIGVESTVISMVCEPYILFRPGFVTKEQIEAVLGKEIQLSKGVESELESTEKVLSPGLKHKHYAPKAQVTIVNADFTKYKELVENEKATALCFEEYKPKLNTTCVTYGSENDSLSQANELFNALRKLDEIGANKVYAMMPSTNGVGLAVYNRLLRAAGFKVINI